MTEPKDEKRDAARKMTVPWSCDKCATNGFGAEISDDRRAWMQLPPGWWVYPIDHRGLGDGDDNNDDGCTIMLHAFCSEKCIRGAIEDAARKAAVAAGQAPLRATLGELRNRRIVGR